MDLYIDQWIAEQQELRGEPEQMAVPPVAGGPLTMTTGGGDGA